MDKGKCGYLGCISGWSGALMGPLGSQMVNLGHQDTNWLCGNNKGVLDFTAGWAHTSMDKGKRGYLRCISGCYGALRGALRVTDG